MLPTDFLRPEAPAGRGFTLDAETAEHLPFLRRLFAAERERELAFLPLDERGKEAFLNSQFDAQRRYYLSQYRSPTLLVLNGPDGPAGRFYLAEDEGNGARVLDITLAAEIRGRGIGGALIAGLQSRLAPLGRGVSLHVDKTNPAQRLYLRLGFRVTGDAGVSWRMDWSPPC